MEKRQWNFLLGFQEVALDIYRHVSRLRYYFLVKGNLLLFFRIHPRPKGEIHVWLHAYDTSEYVESCPNLQLIMWQTIFCLSSVPSATILLFYFWFCLFSSIVPLTPTSMNEIQIMATLNLEKIPCHFQGFLVYQLNGH